MNLTSQVKTIALNSVKDYFVAINKKYNIPINVLERLWEEETSPKKIAKKKVSPLPSDLSEDEQPKGESSPKKIVKKKVSEHSSSKEEKGEVPAKVNESFTVDELKKMCKSRNLKCSGKKSELIERLLASGVERKESEPPKESKIVKKRAPAIKKPKPEPLPKAKVLEIMMRNIKDINIRMNTFDNLEHPSSGLVFDDKGEFVIGKQHEDGSIIDINEEDIDTCHKYMFKFRYPENLNNGKKTLVKDAELTSFVELEKLLSRPTDYDENDGDTDDEQSEEEESVSSEKE